MTRVALVLADLEGVAGVDDVTALIAGSDRYTHACSLLVEELRAVTAVLRARGYEVRISDSHRPGREQPNILPGAIPGASVIWQPDAYDTALFDGADVLVCVGMHDAAGGSGFAAHTHHVHCAFELGGRSLSEAELVLGLAAVQSVPVLFVSGDDALGKKLDVPFVVTKQAVSPRVAQSRAPELVRSLLVEAAHGEPVAAPALSDQALAVRFKSRWQAELAELSGGLRIDECVVQASGITLGERYRAARGLVHASSQPLGRVVRRYSSSAFAEDATRLMLRPFARAEPFDGVGAAARAALASFLAQTAGDDPPSRALRALTLHMLEAHAPEFSAREGIVNLLDDAVAALGHVSARFPRELDRIEAMARLDAEYVAHERGIPRRADPHEVEAYARALPPSQFLVRWLFAEMAADVGLMPRLVMPPRPLRIASRVQDLYWLTHQFLLATRFLHRALPATGWEAEIEELALSVTEVLEQERLDVAAEIAVCLQLAHEHTCTEHARILSALAKHQRADGVVRDPTTGGALSEPVRARRADAHATATALVAFAGAEERRMWPAITRPGPAKAADEGMRSGHEP